VAEGTGIKNASRNAFIASKRAFTTAGSLLSPTTPHLGLVFIANHTNNLASLIASPLSSIPLSHDPRAALVLSSSSTTRLATYNRIKITKNIFVSIYFLVHLFFFFLFDSQHAYSSIDIACHSPSDQKIPLNNGSTRKPA